MQKIVASTLFSLSFFFLSQTALAWGKTGHETVGAIAGQLIQNSHASAHLARILQPGESLSSISTWADCAKYPKLSYCAGDTAAHKAEWAAFVQQLGKENSGNYHFADTSIQANHYVFNPDLEGEDVVHGMREAIGVLRHDAAAPNPNKLTERQALWLLTHLIGDEHQPLHIGVIAVDGDVKATVGSNLLYPDKSSCLHARWDVNYVEMAKVNAGLPKNSSGVDFARLLIEKHKGEDAEKLSGDIYQYPIDWASETLAVARDYAFKGIALGVKSAGTCGYGTQRTGWTISLPDQYDQNASRIVYAQLWKAGFRLASLLKTIWK